MKLGFQKVTLTHDGHVDIRTRSKLETGQRRISASIDIDIVLSTRRASLSGIDARFAIIVCAGSGACVDDLSHDRFPRSSCASGFVANVVGDRDLVADATIVSGAARPFVIVYWLLAVAVLRVNVSFA